MPATASYPRAAHQLPRTVPTLTVYAGGMVNLNAEATAMGWTSTRPSRTGRFAAVEVKVGKDKLSPEQIEFLAGVRGAGGFACEGRSLDQVQQELLAYLTARTGPATCPHCAGRLTP